MAKTIEFTAKNVKPFSAWLKKFASIENSLLIEVDEAGKCFTAKSYNEEKSVVKYSKISFIDSGLIPKKQSSDPQLIKVGIYNIPRVIKSLDHFLSGEFSFSVQYEEVLEGANKNLAGTALLIKSSSLKVKIECTSLNIFKYISEDIFKNKIARCENLVTAFDLPNVTIEKINSLCDLDKEYKFLEFLTRDKKVFVRGKSFELDIADSSNEDKSLLSIYKDQFDKVDVESYECLFAGDKLVFNSKDSNTVTVTSMVVKDEKYEEESLEF
jgi:hypothetical protein